MPNIWPKIAKERESKKEKTKRDDADERDNLCMIMAVIVAGDLHYAGMESLCINLMREIEGEIERGRESALPSSRTTYA